MATSEIRYYLHMDGVRHQYERFPYPPIPAIALPLRNQGRPLRYERGVALANQRLQSNFQQSHADKRILVAGCGTLEALVVAQQHPKAGEIVAVDFSQHSINISKRRCAIARLRNWLTFFLPGRRLPRINFVCTDLLQWESGSFDYILATNVLQHVNRPDVLLKRLADWLVPDGLMRIVTYPRHSRLWMRITGEWLHRQGLNVQTPHLVKKAHQAISKLPPLHPIRHCFLQHGENRSRTGIIDAFFHQCEKPLSPLEWHQVFQQAHLTWIAEDQAKESQSQLLDKLLPAAASLSPWIKLQILDDLLELTDNPVTWLMKRDNPREIVEHFSPVNSVHKFTHDLDLQAKRELGRGLKRAEQLLSLANISLAEALEVFARELGPRVDSKTGEAISGMSITDYNIQELLELV